MCYNIIESHISIIGKDCKRDKFKNDHCASVIKKELTETNRPLPQWLTDYQNSERKINCFFGEHLLQGNTKPVAICESEKTAIIASVYLPEFIWIAAGNKQGLSVEKCKALAGRNVTLFPDLNGFDEWRKKAKELLNIANFTVSDLLERKASEAEKEQGLDLADYLIRFDYKQFQNKPIIAPQTDLLNIHSNDVLIAPIVTYLSKEFNSASLLFVETTKGKFDLFFDSEGQLFKYRENKELIKRITLFFEKKPVPCKMDNCETWVHVCN